MSRATYLDSSAIVKLAVAEPESGPLRRYLRRRTPYVSSARRVWLHVSATWPYRGVWQRVHEAVARFVGRVAGLAPVGGEVAAKAAAGAAAAVAEPEETTEDEAPTAKPKRGRGKKKEEAAE